MVEFIVETKRADLFIVKDHRPTLKSFPPQHTATDKAYGRLEVRQIDGVQVFCIQCDPTEIVTKILHLMALPASHPERANLARLVSLSRGHCSIENRLHWVRSDEPLLRPLGCGCSGHGLSAKPGHLAAPQGPEPPRSPKRFGSVRDRTSHSSLWLTTLG